MWKILFTKNADKDKKLIKTAGLEEKAKKLLNLMSIDPLQVPPPCEKLLGDLAGYYSRRLNIKHRIVYRLDKEKQIVFVHAMWTHYEK